MVLFQEVGAHQSVVGTSSSSSSRGGGLGRGGEVSVRQVPDSEDDEEDDEDGSEYNSAQHYGLLKVYYNLKSKCITISIILKVYKKDFASTTFSLYIYLFIYLRLYILRLS